MKVRTIIEYILAALIVLMLGGLSGWYFFLRTQSQTNLSQDAARGYGAPAPLGGAAGDASQLPVPAAEPSPAPANIGFLSRIWSTFTGESAIVPALSTSGSLGGGFGELLNVGASVQTRVPSVTPAKNRPPQLWHVTEKPVAGQALIGTSTNVRLRYAERSSGYIFEADPETSTVTRITNTLMPKTYEALTVGGGPESHPSGFPIVRSDGTREPQSRRPANDQPGGWAGNRPTRWESPSTKLARAGQTSGCQG